MNSLASPSTSPAFHFESPVSNVALPAAERRRWWVLHTRPRCEKKMDEWLAARGFGHYLPTRPVLRSYPGKEVTFEHPLFAGYAFGAFSLRERNAVYGSGHAAGILEVADQDRMVRELESIRTALASPAALEECPYLPVGSRARIVSGRLRGLEGIVLRKGRRTKLVLSVEFLQRSLAVEIEPEWLVAAA
jgi:transcriptional antiterminator RfaH